MLSKNSCPCLEAHGGPYMPHRVMRNSRINVLLMAFSILNISLVGILEVPKSPASLYLLFNSPGFTDSESKSIIYKGRCQQLRKCPGPDHSIPTTRLTELAVPKYYGKAISTFMARIFQLNAKSSHIIAFHVKGHHRTELWLG